MTERGERVWDAARARIWATMKDWYNYPHKREHLTDPDDVLDELFAAARSDERAKTEREMQERYKKRRERTNMFTQWRTVATDPYGSQMGFTYGDTCLDFHPADADHDAPFTLTDENRSQLATALGAIPREKVTAEMIHELSSLPVARMHVPVCLEMDRICPGCSPLGELLALLTEGRDE